MLSGNPIANAGFETPSVGVGSFYDFQANPAGAGWTFGGSAGVAGNGSAYTSASPNAPEGMQVGFLQQGGASISQSVSLNAGTYALGFLAAQRMWDSGAQNFEVLVDGNIVGQFTPSGTHYAGYSTGEFTVTAGVHTIDFLGLDTAGGDNTALIDAVSLIPPAAASFVANDSATQGNWVGTYGTDGYYLADAGESLPSYATLNPSGQQSGVWNYGPSSKRALMQSQGMRIAAFDTSASGFTYDLDLIDGNSHQVALYLLDWDGLNRSETVTVADSNSGAILDRQTVSNFSGGQYLVWNLQGQVTITLTCTGGPNAVASGIFFDPARDPAVPKPTGLTASTGSGSVSVQWAADTTGQVAGYNVYRESVDGGTPTLLTATPVTQPGYLDASAPAGTSFYSVESVGLSGTCSEPAIIQADVAPSAAPLPFVSQDVTTQGGWVGMYGSDGYAPLGGALGESLPDYVRYSDNGASGVWQYGAAGPVAMQNAPTDTGDRSAAADFGNSPTENTQSTLSIDLTLTDGQAHQVALYMMDWNNQGRQQTVTVTNADTGSQLDTRIVSNFQDGVWLVWNLQGQVTITITCTTANVTAVASALMFDPATTDRPAAPTNLSAVDSPSGVQLNWSASTAANVAGYDVYRRSSSAGAFVQLNSVPLPGTSYTDTAASTGAANFYRVVAVTSDGQTSPAATVVPTSLSFVRADTGTQGSWAGVYGSDGYSLFNEGGIATPYAQSTLAGGQFWNSSWNTPDVRALQNSATDSGRAVSGYGSTTGSFSINLNLTDGQTHQVAIYLLDWFNGGLSETVTVSDTVSGRELNTQTVSNFGSGTWLVWTLSGNVTISITSAPGQWIVASGLFFDTPPLTRPAAPASLSATSTPGGVLLQWAANTEPNLAGYNLYRRNATSGPFTELNSSLLANPSYDDTTAPQGQVSYYRVVAVNTLGQGSTASSVESTPSSISSSFARLIATDTTTEGSWQGVYGSDGFTLLADYDPLPSYANYQVYGANSYGWAWSTTDVRAVQVPAYDTRMATCVYASSGFTINLNLADGQTHQVALYLLDWDTLNLRAETVQVTDAATGTVLDTQSVSHFTNGLWLVWQIQGEVDIKVTSTNGYNAVATALMFAPATPATPSNLTARPISAQQVALAWSASSGLVSGYDIQRSTDGIYFTTIATGVQSTSYNDLTAQPDTTYTYQVLAETGGVESSPTLPATATTPDAAAPQTPTGLTATATGPNSVSLSWNPVAWATTITIDRIDPNGNSTTIATLDGSATSFDDDNISNAPQEDTAYRYHVTATNQYSPAEPAYACIECTTPLAAPSNLTATPGEDSNGNPQISLSWSNNTNDQSAIPQVERSTDGVNFTALPLPEGWYYGSSNYTDTGLSPATHYWYRIQAVDLNLSPQLDSAYASADTTTASSSSNDLTITHIVAVSPSQLSLTWNAYTPDAGQTVTAFEVDRSTDGINFAPIVTDLDPASTGYDDAGLPDDAHFWYVVRAVESDGTTPASQPLDAWTAPLAPQDLSVSGSSNAMYLSWTYTGTDSPSFRIYRQGPDDAGFTSLVTISGQNSYTDNSSISAGSDYAYQVVAVAGDNTTLSAASNTASANATLPPPTALTAAAFGGNAVVVSWTPVPGAVSYNILRQGPGDAGLVPFDTATGTPYYDGSVQGQSTYTYEVIAIDDTGAQAASTTISVTTPPATSDAPANLAAVSSPGQIALTWSAPSGPVTGYNVWRSIGAGSTNFVEIAPGVQSPAYTDAQLVPGLTYSYYVQAENAGAVSYPSASVQATAVPAEPNGLTVIGVSSSSVQLSWSATAGALDYSILREGPGQSSYLPVGTADTNTYTDTTVSANQTYSYEVAAYDAGGESWASASVTTSTSTTAPLVPTGLLVSASDAVSVSLTWNASADTILYRILRRGIGDDAFAVVGTSYQPSYVDTNVTAGDTYGYQVVAVNNSGDSPTGVVVFARPPAVAPSAPAGLTLTDDTDGQVTLAWSASAGTVTACHVQRSIEGGAFAQIAADVQGTQYIDTVPAGVSVSYRVSAENAGSFSGFSNVASITPTPATVTALTLSAVTTSSLTLTWAAPSGAITYTVMRLGPGDASYQTVGSDISAPTFTDASVSPGATYTYEVIAADSGGDSPASSPLSVTVPAPVPSVPSSLAAAADSSTQVTLTWTASTGAVTAYHVERSTDGINFTEIDADVPATTYTDNGLQPNTSYTYRVRAENEVAFSGYSNAEPVTTPAASAPGMPANLSAIASIDGIALQWSPNTEGDLAGYQVLRSASASSGFVEIDSTLFTAPAFDDTTAPAGVISYYQVQAVNSSGQASPPATASATRPASVAAVPANLVATQVSAAGVLLTWTGPQGVTYNVYRNGQSEPIATGIQSAAYLDTSASAGQSYSYTVSSTDNSGNSSAQSAALPVAVPASSTSYDSTPPTAPGGLTASANGYGQIDLAWSASTDNVGYEILRNGVQVGVTYGVAFYDGGLTPGTYNYSVIAFDADDNESAPATTTGSTGADATPPNAPLDVQVTAISASSVSLGWVQPWDNVGVDHYDVTRSSPVSPNTPVDLGTTPTPSMTASGLTAGTSYTFQVTAYDAAGNKSASTSATVTTPGDAAPVDQAPNQYIPQVWQNYFYNTLTAALREKITQLPTGGPNAVTIPHASGWLSVVSPQSLGAPAAAGLLTNGLFPATNVWFHDLNGNGLLDPSESEVVSANPPGAPNSSTQVWYIGPNSNGIYDPNQDVIVPDPWMIQGTSGQYDYCDLTGSGQYVTGDPVWAGGSVFQTGDTVIAGSPTPGMYGRTNGIYSYNAGGNAGPLIWADPDNFRQDFVAFYNAMDALIPHFASGQAYPNDAYTVGGLLASINATPVAGLGTISIQTSGNPPQGTVVTGSGTHFLSQFVTDDNIEINGNWYPIAGVASDTQLSLAQPYFGPSIGGSSYALINWTKVPQTTDADTGLSFSFTRGQPDADSALFPQQFQQLHDALQQLNSYPQRYGQTVFDQKTSAAIIAAATPVINVYESLFGVPGPGSSATDGLRTFIDGGGVDPGAVYTTSAIVTMQGMIGAILQDVYARGPDNGWTLSPSGSGPETLWAELNNPFPLVWEAVTTGGPITPAALSQISELLGTINANGLWISKPGAREEDQPGDVLQFSNQQGPLVGGMYPDTLLPPEDWTGPVSWINAFVPEPGVGTDDLWHWMTSYGPPEYNATGDDWTAQLPAANNQYGGSNVTAMGSYPAVTGIDTSGWAWSGQPILLQFSAAEMLGWLAIPFSKGNFQFGAYSGTTTSVSYPVGAKPFLTYNIAWATLSWTQGQTWYYGQHIYITENIPALPSLYGEVPIGGNFSYTPATQPAPNGALLPPPTGPLPLTTAMDYFNVMPDNGIDGIVNTPANLSTFGNDSGVVTFTAQNGMAQTLLPINVSTSGTLPVNGYLSQGAFGSEQDSVGTLLSQDIAVADSSQDGVPWAYSLDTHVRVNLLVDDAANHVKRIEVIRPGGNAVVFDFAWDSTTGMFSPTGTPQGWNGRDDQQTFVLRALNPTVDTSLNYELLFANGIVQTFNGNLVSVSDSSTGLTQTVYGGSLPLSNGQQNVGISPRYNITLNWTDGNLSEAEYQTKGQAPQTIDTAITYGGDGGNDVTGLNKTDNGSAIPQFSYSVAEETILGDGIEITRSGSVDSGSVEIDTVLTGGTGEASGSSTSETYTFNEHGLVTSDALTLNGGSGTQSAPAVTSYQYQGGGGLYTNGEPQWAKVTLVTNPDGSWVGYSYDPSTGWVTARLTPFQSGDGNVETYGYDPTQSGNGQAPDPSLLVQPPDTVTDYVLGTQTGKTFNDYNGLQIITREALTGSNATWATAGMFSTTTISAYDAVSTNSISGNLSEQKFDFGGAVSYVTTASWLGPMLSNTIDAYNAFGVLTSESAEADGQPSTTYTATASDGFGRTTQASLSGGLTESFNYYPSDWLGPSSVTEADGSTTMYTYTPLGQVATETDNYGLQYSTVTSYVYDAMGNVVSEKVAPADGSSSLTDIYSYDAQGRQTSETDNAGGSDQTANRTTSTVYTSNGTYNISTTTNPDGSTDIEKDYLDGSVASVGGTAQTPASYSYGVIGTDTPDGDGNTETQGSTYATASTDGGQNTTTTYSNVLGEDYLSVESAPGAGATASAGQPTTVDSTTTFDGNQRPTETVGFDGSKSFAIYDPTSGQLGASWASMDGSSTFDASDSKTLYSSSFGGSSSTLLSTSGIQTDTLNYTNGGLTTTENLNGLSTVTNTVMDGGGASHVTTTNPDGTSEKDSYSSGLLTDSQQLAVGGGVVSDTSSYYNPNGTLQYSIDYTGRTNYTWFQDGTEKSVQAPGQTAPQW